MGADYRGLGAVRSLGRRGIHVCVLHQGDYKPARLSRFARKALFWPSGDDATRLTALIALAEKHKLQGWMLVPTDDAAVGFVARQHEQLAPFFLLATPPWKVVQLLTDKRLLHELARQLDIDQPWVFRPRDRAELAGKEITFPVIIKPTGRETVNRLTEEKAWKVHDRASLLDRYDEACRLVSPQDILIQELIPGGGQAQYSFAALCHSGNPLAWIVAKRIRQFPMEFGRFSTFVETADMPAVMEPAVRLLAAVQFTGLVEVEFKRDLRDGKYKLLDVNPRLWGWHTLGARAGVDFSYLLWQMLHGEPVPAVRARPGVQWVRTACDLPIVFSEILKGRLCLNEYLRTLIYPTESALFAVDDPLPALLEVPLLAHGMCKSLLRGAKK